MEVPSPAAGTVQGDRAQGRRQGARRNARPIARKRARRGAAQPAPPAPAATRARAGSAHRGGAATRHRPPAPARREPRPPSPTRRRIKAARVAVGAQVRARARRRPRAGDGQRAEGPHPAGGRPGVREAVIARRSAAAARAAAPAAAARSNLLPWPRWISRSSARSRRKPLSRIKKISGAEPRAQLGDDPARHAVRRSRHHRPRGVPRRAQQGEREGRRQADDARVPDQGVASRRCKKFPDFNASLDATATTSSCKQYFHIGFAADTPNGLVVPVIKDADQKGVLADREGDGRALREGARRQARPGRHAGRMLLDQLARRHRRHRVHADHQRARGRDPRRVARARRSRCGTARRSCRGSMLPLSLSYDHRVIDGAPAARFTAYFASVLADLRRALL